MAHPRTRKTRVEPQRRANKAAIFGAVSDGPAAHPYTMKMWPCASPSPTLPTDRPAGGRVSLVPLRPRSSLDLGPDAHPILLQPLRRARLAEWLTTAGATGRSSYFRRGSDAGGSVCTTSSRYPVACSRCHRGALKDITSTRTVFYGLRATGYRLLRRRREARVNLRGSVTCERTVLNHALFS